MSKPSRTELAAIWPPTASAVREAGPKPQSPLQAIREKCRDCSCYQLNEIRACEAVNCAIWPFRAGKHPWRAEARKTPLNDANSKEQTTPGDEGTESGSLSISRSNSLRSSKAEHSTRQPPASCSRSSSPFRPARVCAYAMAPGNIQTDGFSEADCKMISEAVVPLRVENFRLVLEMQDHGGAA
jgi:hypothetical protein